MLQGIRVKKLNNEIKKNSFTYSLIQRTQNKAIYRQENNGYEVFKIKLSSPHPKAEEDIKNFDKIERFPADEDFGSHAWYYLSLKDAFDRYERL